ncbi:hypothetical protein PVL30_002951 [Lodderomyces elongisporus]|uniref:Uncharacterized protein n=1 Tax=Lodderomyces elongisporus (strain ATCC 11503 / CBS 2605 / JCM 1781 / NBRC 1676 / NRRL YB-4239) TaxID=379508 RepID=A5E1H6_LODEL|nr:uncharacterized protein PVL30_002951 [Lodderomyces elongisporus]EDK45284.1 conserved hypothetical protein [Lodderomyces elongisporus NRRL YB-4239]WLF79200.1 hypothetical protein PVL30_002951 [Lodderomyces elongisporus]
MVLVSLRTFLLGLIVFYSTYLYNYKCPTLTFGENLETKLFHPLRSQHSTLCELLHGGVNKVEPYTTQAHAFLDEHVHSHPLFIKYKVHDKAVAAKEQFDKYAYPVIEQLYEFTDVFEVKAYDQISDLYKKANEFVYGKLKQD